MNTKPLRQRFDTKYTPVTESGCWLWTSTCGQDGYGRIICSITKRRIVLAHRAAWELYRGPIPDGMWILHNCDVKCCVNPDHLYIGTAADNSADCVKRGKYKPHYGENHPVASLTDDQVRYIRSSQLPTFKLAKELCVPHYTIARARRRITWKHLT